MQIVHTVNNEKGRRKDEKKGKQQDNGSLEEPKNGGKGQKVVRNDVKRTQGGWCGRSEGDGKMKNRHKPVPKL